ncbi:extracellular solute-binding protein [Nonomuraea sp. NPDC050643]|uniref:extracellular solute-binding protein n=1 Tax=Nonomuraea sp. NPDC050643 TaxID=3155660 RepID=UPI0033C2C4CD
MRRLRPAPVAPILAVSLIMLAACSESGGGADRELTVWIMGDSSAHFQELVRPFTDRTGIGVDTVAIPWDSADQKLTTAVASGRGPDVLQIGLSKARVIAGSGALLELDEETLKGHANLTARNFLGGLPAADGKAGGKAVSVPWVSDTRVLFYRTDVLAAKGITRPPETWDQVRADARLLASRGAGAFGYFIPQWDSALPVIMTWAMGGHIVNADGEIAFDTPAFRKAVDLYTGMYADRSVPADTDFDQVQGFVSGVTPMLVSGPYLAGAIASAAPELAGKWAIALTPGDVTRTSLLAGSNLGVWGTTDDRDGALRLLDYLADPRTQLTWYRLDGQLPAARSALGEVRRSPDPAAKVYSKQLDDARPLPQVPNWDGETGKALLDTLNAIVLTGANRDTALRGLYAATDGTPAR